MDTSESVAENHLKMLIRFGIYGWQLRLVKQNVVKSLRFLILIVFFVWEILFDLGPSSFYLDFYFLKHDLRHCDWEKYRLWSARSFVVCDVIYWFPFSRCSTCRNWSTERPKEQLKFRVPYKLHVWGNYVFLVTFTNYYYWIITKFLTIGNGLFFFQIKLRGPICFLFLEFIFLKTKIKNSFSNSSF